MDTQEDRQQINIWRQRIGYGVSDFACNLIWQMISLYLLFFYTDIMKLDAASISLMFIVTRIIDGLTDLLVGYMIDHTNSKWGKSRPYFLFGAIPFALFAYLCFNVPDLSQNGKLIYAYITYIGLSFGYTLVNVPMASILPSLTSDTNERTALSTSRKFFGFLGATIVSSSALFLVNKLGNGNQIHGFSRVMLLFGIIGFLIFLITFWNVREANIPESQRLSLKQVFWSLDQNKPWKIFALNILLMWTGFFIQTGALVYYYTSVIGSKSLSVTVATLMSVVPMIANFFVPTFSKKFGKRNLYNLSALIQGMGIIVILFGGNVRSIILLGAFVSAVGYGMKESIYFSMQADPVDYGEWKTGLNVSGSLSAINGFLGKVAQAIAGGVSGFLLSWGNYQEAPQSVNSILAIKAMYGYIPLVLLVLSVILMMFYKLDDMYDTRKRI